MSLWTAWGQAPKVAHLGFLALMGAYSDAVSTFTVFSMTGTSSGENNFVIKTLYGLFGSVSPFVWLPMEFTAIFTGALIMLRYGQMFPKAARLSFWMARLLAVSGFLAFGNNVGVIWGLLH